MPYRTRYGYTSGGGTEMGFMSTGAGGSGGADASFATLSSLAIGQDMQQAAWDQQVTIGPFWVGVSQGANGEPELGIIPAPLAPLTSIYDNENLMEVTSQIHVVGLALPGDTGYLGTDLSQLSAAPDQGIPISPWNFLLGSVAPFLGDMGESDLATYSDLLLGDTNPIVGSWSSWQADARAAYEEASGLLRSGWSPGTGLDADDPTLTITSGEPSVIFIIDPTAFCQAAHSNEGICAYYGGGGMQNW